MSAHSANNKVRLYVGMAKIKKGYIGDKRFYSSGNICTYHVDTGVTYQEEVDEGASCLTPKTFTPAKSGWTFIGWRTDNAANATVLTSKVMGDEPVNLYAVFRATVRLSYLGNGNTGGSTAYQDNYRFYNNGNVTNATFTLRANGFTKSYHTFAGWSVPGAGTLAAGKTVTLSADTIAIATWTTVNTYFVNSGNMLINYTRASLPGKSGDGSSDNDGKRYNYSASFNKDGNTSHGNAPNSNAKPCLYITMGGYGYGPGVDAYVEWDLPEGFRYYRYDILVGASAQNGNYQSAWTQLILINRNTGAVVKQTNKAEVISQFEGGQRYLPNDKTFTTYTIDLGAKATYPVTLRVLLHGYHGGTLSNDYNQISQVWFPTVRIYN